MPHIIIEYSKNLGEIIEISDLVSGLHKALSDEGIDRARIKTRAYAIDYVMVGDHDLSGHMIHTTLLLLEGRDLETKKQYGDALHKTMHDHIDDIVNECAVTLEIRDMDKDTYYL